jgi:DNA-binding transcriptional regulator/RsmH inhibitor MraZ
MGDGPSLVGPFEHGFDAKFRVVIPSIYRPVFADGGFLYKMPRDGAYVALDPSQRFERVLDLLEQRVTAHLLPRDVLTAAYEAARPFSADVQGRVFVPPDFREFARMGNEVELHGRRTHLAIMRTPVVPPSERANESLEDFFETEAV